MQTKENLLKFLSLIKEVSNEEGNEWFKQDLQNNYSKNLTNPIFDDFNEESIKKIYEYCLKNIIRSQANKFYQEFKLAEIKEILINDFIRMEHFRRQDDFENFCLALFQQLEAIVNHLFLNVEFKNRIILEKQNAAITRYDKDGRQIRTGISVGKLLAQYGNDLKVYELFSKEINSWFFNNKLRAVLYFFCFNSEIKYNTDEYEKLYEMGNYIYQMRNLNHRGGKKTEYQNQIIDKVLPFSHKYYLRFLGFLEEFVTTIDDSSFVNNMVPTTNLSANNVFANNEVLNKIKNKLQ